MRHVALLRGVNVGGHNKLPMKVLARIFEELGCDEVRTYIQSGNVVYSAPRALARGIAPAVSERLQAELGLALPVITRSARELAEAVEQNPFLAGRAGGRARRPADVDEAHLHLGFLAHRPSSAAAARLDPVRSPGDEFVLRGREVYLCCPQGLARTKLTSAYFDTTLATTITVRNWRTTLKLCELAHA